MNIQVNEQLIVEALDGMRKNDTQSITEAGNYLLFVIKNPTNLMLLFAIVNSAYSNSVTTDSSLLTPRLVNLLHYFVEEWCFSFIRALMLIPEL